MEINVIKNFYILCEDLKTFTEETQLKCSKQDMLNIDSINIKSNVNNENGKIELEIVFKTNYKNEYKNVYKDSDFWKDKIKTLGINNPKSFWTFADNLTFNFLAYNKEEDILFGRLFFRFILRD